MIVRLHDVAYLLICLYINIWIMKIQTSTAGSLGNKYQMSILVFNNYVIKFILLHHM